MAGEMDRYWLLTWITYGTWLPGDKRGFVSDVPVESGGYLRHNIPGTPYDANNPERECAARKRLKCPPIRLVQRQAEALLSQFLDTADYRRWQMLAVGIMTNHCHIVVGVPGDPSLSRILGDFKSYGSRALSQQWPTPKSGTWWTASDRNASFRMMMRFLRPQTKNSSSCIR